MVSIDIPHLTEVSETNQGYIAYFNKKLGHIPNLFAAMMHSKNALSAYYPFHTRKTSLSVRESEAITLVVSQQNEAKYCLSVHTMIGKLNGFSEEEILELREGTASFDSKLNVLVRLVKNIVEQRGKPDNALLDQFFAEGYTCENLVDALYVVGDNFITNFTAKILDVPLDFPMAEEL